MAPLRFVGSRGSQDLRGGARPCARVAPGGTAVRSKDGRRVFHRLWGNVSNVCKGVAHREAPAARSPNASRTVSLTATRRQRPLPATASGETDGCVLACV